MPFDRLRFALFTLGVAAALTGCHGCLARPVSGMNQCTGCHGDPERGSAVAINDAAPPMGIYGGTQPTDLDVGAHQTHLNGKRFSSGFACTQCHPIPGASHPDGVIHFDFGASGNLSPDAVHDTSTHTCSNTYCHGAGPTAPWGTGNATPEWNANPALVPVYCGSCHALPPPASTGHPSVTGGLTACNGCHPQTVDAAGDLILSSGKHINGVIDASVSGCQGCHGAPPASGAHLLHATPPSLQDVAYGSTAVLEDVAPAGAPNYYFGCGQCHPINSAYHQNGTVNVDLDPTGAPSGSLKSRNGAGAAYDPMTKTCANVYCHSSGQETPTYVAQTPAWDAAQGQLGCAGCHANPPRYPSGGGGAADANGHVQLTWDAVFLGTYEWGHFGGLPGPFHTSKHGGQYPGDNNDAAPITCATCHYDTVDPAANGPSGFYWLDTSGNYDLGGALGYACSNCHTGAAGAPAQGLDKVLPLRHVNGRRDVVFDPRTSLPAITWLPAAPNTPTRPYWVTNAFVGTIPPDAVMDGATMSLHFASVTYDPATKTCSNVACHLSQTTVQWGAPYYAASDPTYGCNACHAY